MSLTANVIKPINSCNIFGTYYTALPRTGPPAGVASTMSGFVFSQGAQISGPTCCLVYIEYDRALTQPGLD